MMHLDDRHVAHYKARLRDLARDLTGLTPTDDLDRDAIKRVQAWADIWQVILDEQPSR